MASGEREPGRVVRWDGARDEILGEVRDCDALLFS